MQGREAPVLVGAPAGEAAQILSDSDIAVSWRYVYETGLGENEGYWECWCVVPPDGTVQDVFLGDEGGWLIVVVERDGRILGGRSQPVLGWGCEPEPTGESSPSAARGAAG